MNTPVPLPALDWASDEAEGDSLLAGMLVLQCYAKGSNCLLLQVGPVAAHCLRCLKYNNSTEEAQSSQLRRLKL